MFTIVVYNSLIIKLLSFEGLVLYPFVLLSASQNEILPSVLKHEITHVYQIEREGICNFYCKYLRYMKNDSYENNPFEQEAYFDENKPLTRNDMKKLKLPIDFPTTDKIYKKRKNKNEKIKTKK